MINSLRIYCFFARDELEALVSLLACSRSFDNRWVIFRTGAIIGLFDLFVATAVGIKFCSVFNGIGRGLFLVDFCQITKRLIQTGIQIDVRDTRYFTVFNIAIFEI